MYRNKSLSMIKRSAAFVAGAMALLATSALAQSPTGTSPNTPRPYSWPSFHAGRYEDPSTTGIDPTQTAEEYISQLLGTPSGLFTEPAGYPTPGATLWTQIPSFLLGNYDPANPPGGFGAAAPYPVNNADLHNFRPNTFNTKNVAYWLAPFAYADALVGGGTVDDSVIATPQFSTTGTWTSITGNPVADTATGLEYQTIAASGAGSTATWIITVPATGNYSIVAHLPVSAPNASTAAHYDLSSSNAGFTADKVIVSQKFGGTVSLKSPVFLTAGSTVTVVLDDSLNTSVAGSLVIADSISLLSTAGADQIVDEEDVHNVSPTDFDTTGTWTATTTPETAGSASNGTYLRTPTSTPANATATWQFKPTLSGLYQATVHIPNSDTLAVGDAAKEFRITDAHYVITVTHNAITRKVVDVKKSQTEANSATLLGAPFSVFANDTVKVTLSNETANTLPTGAISQFYVVADTMMLSHTTAATVDSSPVAVNATEYPDIKDARYLGVLAGTVTTEDRDPATNLPRYRGNITAGVDNPDATRRIRQLVYFGRNETLTGDGTDSTIDDTLSGSKFATVGTWTGVSGTIAADTAVNAEYLTAPVGTGTATATWKIPVATAGTYSVTVHLPTAAPDASTSAHYTIAYNNGAAQSTAVTVSQAAGGDVVLLSNVFLAVSTTVTVTLDDTAGVAVAPAVVIADSASITTSANRIGRVYCVDGLTGGVVWRYTLPGVNTKVSAVSTNTEIHSTPAVAKFNVLTDNFSATQKKLCVVVSDDGGHVYCLDAVGNRDGDSIDPNSDKVGTTTAYWIWRPDQNHVKVIKSNGGQDDTLPEKNKTFDSASDLFAPQAFQTASPTIAVDGSGNGTIYIGNKNGVLYALDATGVPAYSDPAGINDISPYLRSARLLGNLSDVTKATAKPIWWFSVSGSAAGGAGSAAIESAPSLDSNGAGTYRIYFGSSHELGGTSNYGRIYALDSSGPDAPPNSPNATVKPGTLGYNTSVAAWEFPRARELSAALKVRPALGSITGSPVVYRYPGAAATSIYFAANTGAEIPAGSAAGTAPARDSDGNTGRIWSIQPGATAASFNWAYPTTTDPNAVAFDTTVQTTLPIGGFLHATPAVGVVQFPKIIQYDPPAPKDYLHVDAVNNTAVGVRGQNVPMLYVGTAGQDNAMYALDLLGSDDSQRGVYRIDAPNGSRFESSPALLVNANNTPAGGSGGMVYCTAGTLLYQFSATPLSNNTVNTDDPSGYQPFARIAVDAIFGNCGPVSSPTLAAAEVTDISPSLGVGLTNTTDWLYVGDTTTGLTKGLTPATQNGGFDPGTFIPGQPTLPPGIDVPPAYSPIETLHIHIFDGSAAHPGTSANMGDENKVGQDLPVFEWGDSAYIRVSNIVPANPADGDATLRVPDPDPANPGVYYFTDGQPVTVQIGDVGPTITANDNGTIPNINQLLATSLPADGFYIRTDASTIDVLKDDPGARKWFGAYTYAIRDGTGRLNTPGSMRRVTLARQTAQVRTVAGNAYVGTVTLQSQIGNSQVDPTFGILNPLALDGGAKNLVTGAVVGPGIMGSIGPNAVVTSPIAGTDAQALANGNSIYSGAVPPNGYSLGGGDPTNPSAGTGGAAATAYPTVYRTVATATGEINHGSSGTNNGLLTIADRSLLPASGGSLRVRMEQSPLQWNDPTGIDGAQATINPLPWETMPVSYSAGANRSPDYPDIPSNGVNEILKYVGGSPTTNLNTSSALVSVPNNRFVTSNITLSVHAPKYQPANLTGGVATGVANGYHTRVRVFVDSNQNSVWDFGEAYRDVDLQSGVLADMSTSIVENTTDVGAVPQGFGLHTDAYSDLGSFLPPGDPFVSPAVSTPGNYGQFFKPVTVHNNGNVNLVNAQFDQRIYQYPAGNPRQDLSIALLSEGVDNTASIQAYDNAQLTGTKRYLVRTSIDHDLTAIVQNPVVAGKYPGATFHKSRVGDGAPSILSVPDRSADDYGVSSNPYVSVAVPFGTPIGTYHQTLRLFEGMDTAGYNWLVGPTYVGQKAGHALITPASADAIQLDGFAQIDTGGKLESVQPYSEPGTTVKVSVTEARLTKNKIFGDLPMIDETGASVGSNYLPSAFRDLFWGTGVGGPSGSGKVNLLWTSTRSTPASIFSTALPSLGSTFPLNGFTTSSAASWFAAPVNPTAVAGLNAGASVAQEQHVYDANGDRFISSGAAYGFYGNLVGSATDLICSKVDMTSGVPMLTGTASDITQNDHITPKYGVHGLKVSSNLSGSGVTFPSANGGANSISEDLWAFWYTGARGGSNIQYSATTTTNSGDVTGTWRNPATLPIPAGLSAVSDPSAVLIPGPTPQIQVTYTGVSPDGNSDIYYSYYQPFHPYKADPSNATAVNGAVPDDTKVGLLLMAMPSINEYLQPDATNLWWQARDVAWLRMTTLPININNTTLGAPTPPTYDRASGLLTFTGVTGGPNQSQTVYIDLARGRVRFRPSLPKNAVVYATFQPRAKRITTDALADSAATTILDEAYKYNENGLIGSRVSTGRMWYIYRKSGGAGAGVKPSLFYKNQRLTVDLHDANNRTISIKLNDVGQPIVTVSMGSLGTIYDTSTPTANVDIDWKRGRLYFPLNIGGTRTEGQQVTVNFTYDDKSASGAAGPAIVSNVQWMDEARGTDISSPSAESKSGGADSSERAIPMKTVVNESGVTAFLDPSAYADVLGGSYQYDVLSAGYIKKSTDLPHNIWLFWSSNRNRAGDLYSEVLNPRFSSDTP
jgi:hypothetical protein